MPVRLYNRCLAGIFCIFCCWQTPALANDYFAERLQFSNAQKLLKQGREKEFLKVLKKLEHYPIQHYLRYRWLLKKMKKGSEDLQPAILKFIAEYPESHLASKLMFRWQSRVFGQARWQDFIQLTQHSHAHVQPCKTYEARLHLGEIAADKHLLRELWLNQALDSAACLQVGKQVLESVQPDSQLIWRRIDRAMQRGHWRLAKTMSGLLSKQDKTLLSLWIKAYRNPGDNADNPDLRKDTAPVRRIVLQQHKRWSRYDAAAADKHWQVARNRYQFDPVKRNEADRYIALRTAYSHLPQALKRLQALPETDRDIRIWIVRVALRMQRWELVVSGINALPDDERGDSQWQYWLARGYAAQGSHERAEHIYKQLANGVDYYSFLAADQLGIAYAIRDETPAWSEQQKTMMLKNTEVLRAREYLFLGLHANARRVWQRFTEPLDAQQRLVSAILSSEWEWYDRGIFALGKTPFKRSLSLRFPAPYRQQVFAMAKRNALDPAWVYGVMRRESAFIADIRSPAGAMGLMQLMPKTAQYVARQMGRTVKTSALIDENTNIALGTHYLNYVKGKFKKNLVLATAAYNAGPHRVRKWLPTKTALPADIWVDTIPFLETRRYVRAVMAYTAIYAWRLERQVIPLNQRMVAIPAKSG